MSETPVDSNNTSDPAQLRRCSESLQHPSNVAAAADPTPPIEEELTPPRRLSRSDRSETAPITSSANSSTSALWPFTRNEPPLAERDTIFATTYAVPRASPPLPDLDNIHNGNLLAEVKQNLGGSTAAKVKPSSRASRKQTQVSFAESPESRFRDRKKAEAYGYEGHELLTDSAIEGLAAEPASMGKQDQQDDTSRRPPASNSQRPSSSPQHYNFDTIDEDERARYRSWRAGNAPWIGSGAAAKKRSRSGDNMHVDKNIEATLPKINPPTVSARSRKSSQYLGLFKEKDVAEEKKKRDQLAKENAGIAKEGEMEQTEEQPMKITIAKTDDFYAEPEPFVPATATTDTYDALSHGGPKTTKDAPARLARTRTDFALDSEEWARTQPVSILKAPKSLSTRLVEEMKHRHDIELSSDSERLLSRSYTSKRIDRSRLPSPKASTPTEEVTDYVSRRESDESSRKSPLSDEEEGSEHEQISKALYYPHRHLVLEEDEREPSPALLARVLEDVSIAEASLTPTTEKKLIDAERERAINEVELSLQTADETEHFHGQLSAVTSPPDEESYVSSQDLSGTDYETADETSRSAFYDSSGSDEVSTTPKASPKHIFARKHHSHAPLGAVELTPYDHQVGGHSTVYRFSRRAICKQLNNRENIFYETVEREHPELVTFMPRYIGVLNVTYQKAAKRRKTTTASTPQDQISPSVKAAASDKGNMDGTATTAEANGDAAPTHRIVSHSQQVTPVPQVVLEHNRHIIPNNLFRGSSRSSTPRPQSSDPSLLSQMHRWSSQSDDHLAPPDFSQPQSAETSPSRPCFKQNASWGATTVNTRLKEQVLREVFAAPPIHRHRKGRHYRSLSNTRHLHSNVNEVVGSAPPSQSVDASKSKHASFAGTESLRRALLRGEHERNGLTRTSSAGVSGISPPESPSLVPQRTNSASDRASDDVPLSEARRSRRRHSGGGLLRRPFDLDSNKRLPLEFHEEEPGYRGDGEEDVFSMEDDTSVVSSRNAAESPSIASFDDAQGSNMASLPTPPIDHSDNSPYDGMFEPNNPKQALADMDERVQLFILLEDLTAGMSKPCVLDLKMGTRQYGVEANQKKKRSQRQKCSSTTSQNLGVRVCGMQIFDVKTQSVVFKDKYYGRDLKAGREFQEALKGFFFDGYGYSAALKHIPRILDKISSLEAMIRQLPGYRFYASSLLMLYDRAASDEAQVTNIGGDKKSQSKLREELKKKAEIKLKIVDFANCVTAEDPPPPEVPCPPHDPDDIDRGYLRGLRSLRLYFQRIWTELNESKFQERGDFENAMTMGSNGVGDHVERYEDASLFIDDEGNVSF